MKRGITIINTEKELETFTVEIDQEKFLKQPTIIKEKGQSKYHK